MQAGGYLTWQCLLSCKMIRTAASLVALCNQSLMPKESSHNPLLIATRATTLWLKQPICFFSVGLHVHLTCAHIQQLQPHSQASTPALKQWQSHHTCMHWCTQTTSDPSLKEQHTSENLRGSHRFCASYSDPHLISRCITVYDNVHQTSPALPQKAGAQELMELLSLISAAQLTFCGHITPQRCMQNSKLEPRCGSYWLTTDREVYFSCGTHMVPESLSVHTWHCTYLLISLFAIFPSSEMAIFLP